MKSLQSNLNAFATNGEKSGNQYALNVINGNMQVLAWIKSLNFTKESCEETKGSTNLAKYKFFLCCHSEREIGSTIRLEKFGKMHPLPRLVNKNNNNINGAILKTNVRTTLKQTTFFCEPSVKWYFIITQCFPITRGHFTCFINELLMLWTACLP